MRLTRRIYATLLTVKRVKRSMETSGGKDRQRREREKEEGEGRHSIIVKSTNCSLSYTHTHVSPYTFSHSFSLSLLVHWLGLLAFPQFESDIQM